MGRVLKRVPMDFDWPLGKVWYGYALTRERAAELFGKENELAEACGKEANPNGSVCATCDRLHPDGCSETAEYCLVYNDRFRGRWYCDPPCGEGYQLWETVTEGSPQSPVFPTLEGLCEWCEENATVFGDMTASASAWFGLLSEGDVHGHEGNFIFG